MISGSRPAGEPEDLWRRFVPDQGLQAERLAEIIEDAVPETSADPACLFAENTISARELRDAVEADLPGWSRPSRRPPVTSTPPSMPSAQAVPSRCWIGTPEGADELTQALQEAELDPTIDLASDAMKTVMPIPGPGGSPLVGELTCPCLDVNLTNSDAARRFINAYQSATGLAPGIYAAEAWDAGTLTAQRLPRRRSRPAADARLRRQFGLLRRYRGTGPIR